ncbi:MAG: hypothetical protein HY681_03105 [Chloroflexi bacterium]|nr:hypothetical protein [Chloroflexota bacterium]
MSKRSREQVMADILRSDGPLTHIMRQCHLEHARARRYVDFLSQAGLLACSHGQGQRKTWYHASPKGQEALSLLNEILEFLREDNPGPDCLLPRPLQAEPPAG